MALSSATVHAAAEPPAACAKSAGAAPAGLIESCTALIDNPATLDADRLNAMIVRARAFYDNGQTDKALAELDAAAAANPEPGACLPRPRRNPSPERQDGGGI